MTPSPSSEVVRAAGGSAADGEMKRAYVRRMFAAVAPRYDLLNHLLSLTLDRRWRRAAVARLGWEARPDGVYLDLCAGTLDLAATLARARGFRGTVIGADRSEEHTSELQSPCNLVCRLLLEKKKKSHIKKRRR